MNDMELRIEKQLTEISKKLEILPEIRERVNNSVKEIDRLDKRAEDHETRLRQLEVMANRNADMTGGIKHFGWVLFGGILSILVSVTAYNLR